MRQYFFIFLFFSYFLFSEPIYKFQKSKIINYSFQLSGNISYSYPGSSEDKFDVLAKGNLKIECIDENEEYTLKVTPVKTFVKVSDAILEDITNSETIISNIISSTIIKMKKNGQIVLIKDIDEKILTLLQILTLLPSFPSNIISGKRWKQIMPALNFPGIPMCNLEFNYLYEKKDNISNIQLIASQIIKESKKDKNIKINFTGKNLSKGNFVFDEEQGEINNFEGNFSIDLNIKFEIPQSPEQKIKKKESLPIKLTLNLILFLLKL
ncbi:MAG: hypothetical protein NC833_01795 [Candidatus Omnitrophica bacterium]|nr:hypothetical protein [Candidatus Omnitrophota bacterium]